MCKHVCVWRKARIEREKNRRGKMRKCVEFVEQNDCHGREKLVWPQSSLQQPSMSEDCGAVLKRSSERENVTQGFYIQPNHLSTIKFIGSFEHERILGISTLEVWDYFQSNFLREIFPNYQNSSSYLLLFSLLMTCPFCLWNLPDLITLYI